MGFSESLTVEPVSEHFTIAIPPQFFFRRVTKRKETSEFGMQNASTVRLKAERGGRGEGGKKEKELSHGALLCLPMSIPR